MHLSPNRNINLRDARRDLRTKERDLIEERRERREKKGGVRAEEKEREVGQAIRQTCSNVKVYNGDVRERERERRERR